jgi:hypothetical protein
MAATKWREVPGGRLKRWKKSHGDTRPMRYIDNVPPRWYRNMLNRRERRRVSRAMHRGDVEARPYVHPREAGWFW